MRPSLLTFILLIAVGAWYAPVVRAAPRATTAPSIAITSPRNGAVIHGTSIVVRVAVANFTLVSPTARHPVKGQAGHIQYVLDDITTYSANDVAAMLSHTWQHVKPGTHTLIAYLATNRHLPVPGTQQSEVAVTVVGPTPRPVPTPATGRRTSGRGGPGVGAAPQTGGGGGNVFPSLDVNLLLAGILALLVGSVLLRRYAFAAVGRGGDGESSVDPRPVEPAEQAPEATEPSLPAPERVAPPVAEPPPATPTGEGSAPRPRPNSPWDLPMPSDPVPRPITEAEASLPPPPEEPRPVTAEVPAPAAAAPVLEEESVRDRAVEMTRQWSDLVQNLVQQLDGAEAERQQMLDRIATLERLVREHEALTSALADLSGDQVSSEELQAVQYVADSLVKDPDHIVVLASVAQNADKIARIVRRYARIQRALGDS